MNFKKIAAVAFAALAFTFASKAQTNLQTFYDLSREHFTTTLEGFYGDKWGNTFFFIDYDFNGKNRDGKNIHSVSSSYMEIARCLNFWQDSNLAPLSLHVEYNGGVGFGNYNFLFGADYFVHSADFKNTLNFKLLYKTFNAGIKSKLPLQFTLVWGCQDIFGVEGLRFSGFADIWGETTAVGKFVAISEPQLWYNIGSLFDCPNLNIGGEVELSNNFAGEGFVCNPCFGFKWDF